MRQFTTPDGNVLTLDPSQDAGVDAILEALKTGREAKLAGAAGCGKSVLMELIIQLWPGNVILLATTGKAASRLSETTGRTAKTVHSGVFESVEELERGRDRGREAKTLLNTLREVVFKAGGKLLLVGDHKQLGPVITEKETLVFGLPTPPEGCRRGTLVIVDESSMLPGADLHAATAVLETVHRQALGSPVLELATLIREGNARAFTNWGDEVRRIPNATIEQAVEWSEECRASDVLLEWAQDDDIKAPSRVLLTWTNKVRIQANRLTRASRKYPKSLVVDGETLLCTFNNHAMGRMNGEVVEVSRVEECPEMTKCLGVKVQWVIETASDGKETRFLVVPETFDAYHPGKSPRQVYRDAWKPLWASNRPQPNRDGSMPESSYQLIMRMGWSWDILSLWRDASREVGLQATWGYCLTAHKSQGSQWDEVGFISCPNFRSHEDQDFKRRFTYTTVTRAAERFTAFILSVVPDYRRKNPYGVD